MNIMWEKLHDIEMESGNIKTKLIAEERKFSRKLVELIISELPHREELIKKWEKEIFKD